MSRPNSFIEPAAPRGITLLEVLIACGVLVLGLASVAALLPAAGSRLGQATVEDRGGVLAANARAEVQLRGLLTADFFPDPKKAVAFGREITNFDPANNTDPIASVVRERLARADPQKLDNMANERAFFLEDTLVYEPPTSAETPLNSFTSGFRSFKTNLRWGATLSPINPDPIGALPGTKCFLAIAIFRGNTAPRRIPLQLNNGLYRLDKETFRDYPEVTAPDEEALMAELQSLTKTHLNGCSYVLAMPIALDASPRWFRITASWVPPIDSETEERADDNGYVSFADPEFDRFAGTNPTVIAFDKLVRVDQYTVTLE